MSDLAAWLLEQIDVDEQAARDAIADDCGEVEGLAGQYDWLTGRNTRVNTPRFGDALARLTVMFAVPARVLAECEAKRRIVEAMQSNWNWSRSADCPEAERRGYYDMAAGLGDALRLLALPYADRPGYDESWRP